MGFGGISIWQLIIVLLPLLVIGGVVLLIVKAVSKPKPTFQPAGAGQPLANGQSNLDELERLHALKEKGIITEEEFNARKGELL